MKKYVPIIYTKLFCVLLAFRGYTVREFHLPHTQVLSIFHDYTSHQWFSLPRIIDPSPLFQDLLVIFRATVAPDRTFLAP
jgi:hypothetical protein